MMKRSLVASEAAGCTSRGDAGKGIGLSGAGDGRSGAVDEREGEALEAACTAGGDELTTDALGEGSVNAGVVAS